MQPLGLVLVFLLLALLILLGIVLTRLGIIRLRRRIRSDTNTKRGIALASLFSVVVAGGLTLIGIGLFGIYRIIFGN